MGKRHPNLPAWQWRTQPQQSAHHVPHLMAVPLFVIGFLLMASGVFSVDLTSFAIGVVGILAGLGLQRRGQSAPSPFDQANTTTL